MPAEAVLQLGKLQGLTRLQLECGSFGPAPEYVHATPLQLAGALQSLTDLQQLSLGPIVWGAKNRGGSGGVGDMTWLGPQDVESAAALLRAVGSLPELDYVRLDVPVRLDFSAVQQLSGMLQQLLPSHLASSCKVSKDHVAL